MQGAPADGPTSQATWEATETSGCNRESCARPGYSPFVPAVKQLTGQEDHDTGAVLALVCAYVAIVA